MPSTSEMARELGKRSAAPKNRETVAREFADALERDHAHRRGHLKLIARTAEVAPATVKNWKLGRHVPGIDVFLRLLPVSPSLQAMCAQVIAMESELSPEFQRELAALIQRHIR